MRETNYNYGVIDKKKIRGAYIARDFFSIAILVGLLVFIIWVIKHPLKPGFFENNSLKALYVTFAGLFFIIIFIGFTSMKAGALKAYRELKKEEQYIKKMNPFVYLRELPNDLGIGVASLLTDSTIENEKDIVAVILDLCAKKYLKLKKFGSKYMIEVLKEPDDHLLSNEIYIMEKIMDGKIEKISYADWYDCCLYDGSHLGLYYHVDREPVPFNANKALRIVNLLQWFIAIILGFLNSYFMYGKLLEYNFDMKLVYLLVPVTTIIFYVVLIIPFYFVKGIAVMLATYKNNKESNYNQMMNNHLIRTEVGIEELFKLQSFKAFLKDFGHFVDKRVDEVVLWDRYLAYAQLFGLTKEIMNTGYKQLVSNSSFDIDDIDNIHFNNIFIQ